MLWLLIACSTEFDFGVEASAQLDADGDGFTPNENDCDDVDPAVSPDAFETCDGLDQNCDGNVDEGADGTSACLVLERTTQVVTLDVLVVVTAATGMADFQSTLALGGIHLLDEVLIPANDVRVAVTSTAALTDTEPGVLRNVFGRSWVDQGVGIPAATDWFATAAQPGELASGYGTDDVRKAVEAAIILPELVDGDFARDWAALAIVILANDDDDSGNDPTLGGLVFALDGVRGLGNTTVYAVVGTGDPKCTAEIGTDHLTLVSRLGGLSTSICADDYDAFLGSSGQNANFNALRDTFPLSSEPVPSSIVASVLLPEGGPPLALSVAQGSLLWEPALNAVRVVGAPPAAGSEITLTYLAVP